MVRLRAANGQHVAREARIDAVDVHRGPAGDARRLDGVDQPGVGVGRVDQPDQGRGDHVGAGRQEGGDLGQRLVGPALGLRRVDDAVGAEGDESVDVVGGQHPGGLVEPAELGRVPTDLGRARGVHPDELQIGSFDDGLQGVAADVAGGELDDSEAHGAHPRRSGGSVLFHPIRGIRCTGGSVVQDCLPMERIRWSQ